MDLIPERLVPEIVDKQWIFYPTVYNIKNFPYQISPILQNDDVIGGPGGQLGSKWTKETFLT